MSGLAKLLNAGLSGFAAAQAQQNRRALELAQMQDMRNMTPGERAQWYGDHLPNFARYSPNGLRQYSTAMDFDGDVRPIYEPIAPLPSGCYTQRRGGAPRVCQWCGGPSAKVECEGCGGKTP